MHASETMAGKNDFSNLLRSAKTYSAVTYST